MSDFEIGELILRTIDEVDYDVEVLSRCADGCYTVKYLDDGTLETGVESCELKRATYMSIPAVLSDSSCDTSPNQSPQTYQPPPPPSPPTHTPTRLQCLNPIPFSTYIALKRQLEGPRHPINSTKDDSTIDAPTTTTATAISQLRRTVSQTNISVSANISAPMLEPLASYCERCFKLCIYRCKGCLGVFYCCKKCQAAAWPMHRKQCGFTSISSSPLLIMPSQKKHEVLASTTSSAFETPPRKRLPLTNTKNTAAKAVENVLDWLHDDAVPLHHPTVIKYNQPSTTTAGILQAVTDNAPAESKSSVATAADASAVANIVDMFNLPQHEVSHCLKHFGGSADQAVEWLLQHPGTLPSASLGSKNAGTDSWDLYGTQWGGNTDLDAKWAAHNQLYDKTQRNEPLPINRSLDTSQLSSIAQSNPSVITSSNSSAAVSIYSGFVDIEERKCNMELRKSRLNDAEIICYLYPKADLHADVITATTAKCQGGRYHQGKNPEQVIRVKVDEGSDITGLKCVGVVHVIKLTVTQVNSLLQSATGADDYKFLDTNSLAYGTRAAKILTQHIRSCVMSPFFDDIMKDYVVLTYQVFGPTGLFYAQSEKTERIEIAYCSIANTNSRSRSAAYVSLEEPGQSIARVDSLETQEDNGDDDGVDVAEVVMIAEVMGCSLEEARRVLRVTGDVGSAIDLLMAGADIEDSPPPLIHSIN